MMVASQKQDCALKEVTEAQQAVVSTPAMAALMAAESPLEAATAASSVFRGPAQGACRPVEGL